MSGGGSDPALGELGPIVRLRSRVVYENPWIHVREDQVRFPGGHEGPYGVVTCKPAVGVLPFVDADHVLLVRQYRYIVGHATWEMPTGGAHRGECLEEAARRELREEAGVAAEHLRPLHRHSTSKSILDETAHLYVAWGLSPVEAGGDLTEELHVASVPFDEVVRMVVDNEIIDAMTVIGALLAERERRPGGRCAAWPFRH